MFEFLQKSRVHGNHGMAYRLGWWLGRGIVGFLALSLTLVVLFKFVPVPVTPTMLFDGNGITKTWTPLSRIDRSMIDAVIAGEDAKFCTHGGFDRAAMALPWRKVNPLAPVTLRFLGWGSAAAIRAASTWLSRAAEWP